MSVHAAKTYAGPAAVTPAQPQRQGGSARASRLLIWRDACSAGLRRETRLLCARCGQNMTRSAGNSPPVWAGRGRAGTSAAARRASASAAQRAPLEQEGVEAQQRDATPRHAALRPNAAAAFAASACQEVAGARRARRRREQAVRLLTCRLLCFRSRNLGRHTSTLRSSASQRASASMTVTREEGCGCPAGGPCGPACTCKPAEGDSPASCVCKVEKKPGCTCPAGGPCEAGCGCAENSCLCKSPREALPPATAAT